MASLECVKFKPMASPGSGQQTVAAPPWKLSATPVGINRRAPLLGEHNRYVFSELLGMTRDEVAELIADEVIY